MVLARNSRNINTQWLKIAPELSEGCPEQYLKPCLTKMTPASNPCSGGSSGIWHLLFEFPAKPNCLPDRNSSFGGHPKSLIYSSWGHYPSKIRCQSSDPLLPFWVLNLTVSCLLVHWYSATYFSHYYPHCSRSGRKLNLSSQQNFHRHVNNHQICSQKMQKLKWYF